MKSMIKNDKNQKFVYADLLQVVYFIIFIIIWILDSFIFKYSTFLISFIPLIIRVILAIIVGVVGSIIVMWGHWLLFNKKLPGLITIGIFAHVRHPMYLGFILLYLGCVIGTLSLLSIIPWLFIIHLYNKMANFEEKKLEQRFGKEFLEYKKKVSKWIPI